MKILHSLTAGLLASTSILARRVFPLLFLGAGLLLAQPCAAGSGGFHATGSLATERYNHTTTLLPNGKVLVVGGTDNSFHVVTSSELYDPASGTWTATGSMNIPGTVATATLLPNGKVLVAGGQGSSGNLARAELYDPASGTWTATGTMNSPISLATATSLSNGKVLVAGGQGSSGAVASAELYDPASGTWTTTGSLATPRLRHFATLLPNGKVLVEGGSNNSNTSLASAELYDPASGTWTATGSLANARNNHTATLLPNGKVLVAGGANSSALGFASSELYDPASGTWTATGDLLTIRVLHTATLLTNGQVLVIGGFDGSGVGSASSELYDPASGTWMMRCNLVTSRGRHTATLLPNDTVLIAAGYHNEGDHGMAIASAELYTSGPCPESGTGATLVNISTRMRVLTGDQVLIAGFIITGTDPKNVIIRGIGPSLTGVGVTLVDPTLELHQGNTTLAINDNWKINDQTGQSQQAAIEATTIQPTNDLESTILTTLSPGTYTAILAGKNGGTGVGVVEVYDLAQAANSQLANISTRGFVDRDDNVMIGGFIVAGGTPNVIVLALGPSIPVPGALADPTLELHNASGTTIATNDNWKINDQTGQSQQAEIAATTLPPTNDFESAVVQRLAPGQYTVIVRGKNNTTGVGLVAAYNLQ